MKFITAMLYNIFLYFCLTEWIWRCFFFVFSLRFFNYMHVIFLHCLLFHRDMVCSININIMFVNGVSFLFGTFQISLVYLFFISESNVSPRLVKVSQNIVFHCLMSAELGVSCDFIATRTWNCNSLGRSSQNFAVTFF